MTARKKWRLMYPCSPASTFKSEAMTYDAVDELRGAWAVGGPVGSLTVQVDAGMGWETVEHIDFASEDKHV